MFLTYAGEIMFVSNVEKNNNIGGYNINKPFETVFVCFLLFLF